MKSRWPVLASVATLFVSFVVPLSYLADGAEWVGWFLGFGAMVFGIGLVGRASGLADKSVGLIQVLALPAAQIAVFAGDVAWLGIIPNEAVMERFWDLGQALSRHLLVAVGPVEPSTGLFSLIAISGGLLAWAFDWYSVTLRTPAATGMFALLVVVVTVAFARPSPPMWAIAPTALAYLAVLAVSAPRAGAPSATAAVIVGAVALGLAASWLPGLRAGSLIKGGEDWTIDLPGDTVRVQSVRANNALVDVGRDLRERDTFEVLRYATASEEPIYLRLTTLGEFTDGEWRHRSAGSVSYTPLVGAATGSGALADPLPLAPLGPDALVGVDIVALESEWVPVPYLAYDLWENSGAPVTVDLGDRTLGWDRLVASGDQYTVRAALAGSPATAQEAALNAAEDVSDPGYFGLESVSPVYLEVPAGLPAVIRQTAREATARAADAAAAGPQFAGALAYAQAEALVDYFLDSGFEYSLQAPVQGEDGLDHGEAIAQFLEQKSGYCVHFAAAMTWMARELGIPARIAVGYAPGRRDAAVDWTYPGAPPEGTVWAYTVGADQLHSWPELYIEGLGWVGFEPTVGVGAAAASPSAAPSASSASPSAAPSASTSAAAPSASPTGASGDAAATAAAPLPLVVWAPVIAGILVVCAAVPGGLAALRRRRRLGQGLAGAWAEVRDTASDLGLGVPAWRTPADFAAELGAALREGGQGAAAVELDRLAKAAATAAYAPPPAPDLPAASVRDLAWPVLRGLAAASPQRARLRARWFPRSLRRPPRGAAKPE
ncbi:MAG: DUF3488 and transglutaminase-like domain-containing protein [Bifidobacteriaceae bacterium]|jgi:transglutaminase-like putative cysteine protease|nr:DUF3488 and transglutaminase-like domain-containing protein [Bifidobacteriaceae bacterium]